MMLRPAALLGLMFAIGASATALAFDEKASEKDALKACETSICEIVAKKSPTGPDLGCAIGKTWKQDRIKAGIGGRVAWHWGDARCSSAIAVPRAMLIEALTKPHAKISLPLHKVSCELERGGSIIPVTITLAPTFHTKNGEVRKFWVNVKTVEAPSVIKGIIWTVARLEDTVGLFHRDLIKGINRFARERCAAKG